MRRARAASWAVDHHICLVVPDIQAAWEQVRVRTPAADRAKLAPPQIGKNDKWQINLYDRMEREWS